MISGVNLSGIGFNSLSCVSAVIPDDAFVLSEPAARAGLIGDVQYISKHAKFSALSAKIMADIAEMRLFGDMISAQLSDYSLIGHSHPGYCEERISSFYGRSGEDVEIASVEINGVRTGIYAPAPAKQVAPMIGQIRFMYEVSKRDIDPYAKGFDGWVYADGRSYRASDFRIGESFDIDPNGMFSVPDFGWFVEMNPRPYEINDLTEKYQHVDPEHSHVAKIQLSGEADARLMYACADCGNGDTSHGASSKQDSWPYEVELDCSNLRITTSGHIGVC